MEHPHLWDKWLYGFESSQFYASIADLKNRIQAAQVKAAAAVNTQLIGLYWDISQQTAQDLTRELKPMKGFSRCYLYRMKQFYAFYAGQGEFVQQLVGEIPWGHNDLIIQKIKDRDKALWYVRKALENGWSRNVLDHQFESRLYEQQAENPRIDNFSERLPVPQSDLAREMINYVDHNITKHFVVQVTM